MIYHVRWRGRYHEVFDENEKPNAKDRAREFAALLLATVREWPPDQRKLHPMILVTDDFGNPVSQLDARDEMRRLADLDKPAKESKSKQRRNHA